MALTINAGELEVGDTIIERGRPEVVVRHVDKRSCRNHIHINKRLCYDNAALVSIGEQKRNDVESKYQDSIVDPLNGPLDSLV